MWDTHIVQCILFHQVDKNVARKFFLVKCVQQSHALNHTDIAHCMDQIVFHVVATSLI